MKEADLGKIVTAKHCSVGSIYLQDMSNDMWAVTILADISGNVIVSRNFPYTEKTKKEVWNTCKAYYDQLKEYLYKRRLDLIESLED